MPAGLFVNLNSLVAWLRHLDLCDLQWGARCGGMKRILLEIVFWVVAVKELLFRNDFLQTKDK